MDRVRAHGSGGGAVIALALACALSGTLASGCSPNVAASRTSFHDAGIRLSPDPAYTSAQIAVVADEGGWDLSQASIRWSRNGSPIEDASGSVLAPASFSPGDLIEVAVTGRDPRTGAHRTLHAAVRVQSTAPSVTRVTLSLASVEASPVVQANVESVAPDGGTPTYAYRWFRNGSPLEGASGPSVPVASVTQGDQLTVEVTASDSAGTSTPVRSQPLLVANLPPRFTSSPANPEGDGRMFTYDAVAVDPDGDPITFTLESGPDGMSVDPQGHVLWLMPTGADRHGDFPVRLRASDGHGGDAVQEFTLHLVPPSGTRAASADSSR
ncbi:MAG TPA: hypothetical protein VMI75_33260 [Polyangiaceae bacterium]|nr:hypothetical protein [Polyangiaceae bacterium]